MYGRARVRDQVLGLLQAGMDAENQGDLEAARHAYAQANQLDSDYSQAAAALRRVTEVIVDEQFRALLSQAIRALYTRRFAESGKVFEVKPGVRVPAVLIQCEEKL